MGKVLIVDDQPAIRRLIFEVLNDEFEIQYACTGEEAIRVSNQFKPDIILLDIGLVGMSGIEALPCLKNIVPECSIIMLTGNTSSGMVNKALSSGACDFIVKPFDVFKMKDKLKNIISQKPAS